MYLDIEIGYREVKYIEIGYIEVKYIDIEYRHKKEGKRE